MILASYMTTACTLKAAILSVQLPFFSFGNGFTSPQILYCAIPWWSLFCFTWGTQTLMKYSLALSKKDNRGSEVPHNSILKVRHFSVLLVYIPFQYISLVQLYLYQVLWSTCLRSFRLPIFCARRDNSSKTASRGRPQACIITKRWYNRSHTSPVRFSRSPFFAAMMVSADSSPTFFKILSSPAPNK